MKLSKKNKKADELDDLAIDIMCAFISSKTRVKIEDVEKVVEAIFKYTEQMS